MNKTEVAQMYLDGERMRKRAMDTKDTKSFKTGNDMMYEAVKEFQKTGESQELLFDQVERLDKAEKGSTENA